MSQVPLTEANFVLYAAQHYDSPFPDDIEFQEDLKRIIYIKRLFNAYQEGSPLKERLILNHLIVVYNMFGEHATPMLFFKLQGHEILLKTFLSFINRMPAKIVGIGPNGKTINNTEIPLDPIVWQKLITI